MNKCITAPGDEEDPPKDFTEIKSDDAEITPKGGSNDATKKKDEAGTTPQPTKIPNGSGWEDEVDPAGDPLITDRIFRGLLGEDAAPYVGALRNMGSQERVLAFYGDLTPPVGTTAGWKKLREIAGTFLARATARIAGHGYLCHRNGIGIAVEIGFATSLPFSHMTSIWQIPGTWGLPERAKAQIGVAGALASIMHCHFREGEKLDESYHWGEIELADVSEFDWGLIECACPDITRDDPEDDDVFNQFAEETFDILRRGWAAVDALRQKIERGFVASGGKISWSADRVASFIEEWELAAGEA